MDDREIARRKRADRRARQLGTRNPVCRLCGLSGLIHRYEHHHLAAQFAGRRLCEVTILLCRQCHDRISDMQNDLPPLPKSLNPLIARWINRRRGWAQLQRLMAELEEADVDAVLAITALNDNEEDVS